MMRLCAALSLAALAGVALGCQAEVAPDGSTKPPPAPALRAARRLTLEQDSAGAPPITEEELNRLLDALEQERDSR